MTTCARVVTLVSLVLLMMIDLNVTLCKERKRERERERERRGPWWWCLRVRHYFNPSGLTLSRGAFLTKSLQ